MTIRPPGLVDHRVSKLTPAFGLRTLEEVTEKVRLDHKRANANIAFTRSMGTWVAQMSPAQIEKTRLTWPPETGADVTVEAVQVEEDNRGDIDAAFVNDADQEEMEKLEKAYGAHVAAFDLNSDDMIDVEECIVIFERSHLFDEYFTPTKVRGYFSTCAAGCNHVHGLSKPLNHRCLTFSEFKEVLQWAADMKQEDFSSCANKIIRLSRRLCDKAASVPKRLEVVFGAFCKKSPTHMSPFEFGSLCRLVEVPITIGDAVSLFRRLPTAVEGPQGKCVDFNGFMLLLGEVGKRLHLDDQVLATFAKAVELLDTDEETITKVKMRMKHAAAIVGGTDLHGFFRSCDPDQSGHIDWDEFFDMCRTRLHLSNNVNHLRILFEKLDADASGELSIDELIDFIES